MKKISIFLVYTDLKDEILLVLKSHLEAVFGCPVNFYGLVFDFSQAYNPKRNQYRSTKIIDLFSKYKKNPREKWVVLVDVDLYAYGLNFVFGEADLRRGIAVVSFVRLNPEFYGLEFDEKLFTERLIKEVTHEIGHLFFLPHCFNPGCVMAFSNTIRDTDRKGKNFCLICDSRLKAYLSMEKLL
ncbi:archaemetzincin family Zn-dependent metalloprotease [Thermodesulfobacterium sp. TA1]|uniref:archaemetzincin family Zn-dependent metalloprotease n=1 Tax=Thermodesulfobacterium sp. TA1 TaxID=2234087 RepID=UPI001231DCF0|nr:archaemetzincin family Zn-dependent metalloprotease [Thermodesulfobacterium sp. TA1]QER42236.1 archaemetzincin family Zn-dependent metalloprotease [Thermodesulfobacterium sp. TA1]